MTRSRITTEPGFLDLIDLLSRGGTADWRALYQRAQGDPELRSDIRAALEFVDPELGAARELWSLLLDRAEQKEHRAHGASKEAQR